MTTSSGPSYTLLIQNGQPFQEASANGHLPGSGEGDGTAAAVEKLDKVEKLYSKLSARLIPLFMLMTALNYLDRSSLAFASIQLTADLGFSPSVYGLASGLFFLSYCACQLPSNLVCMKLGPQKWLAAIMLAWGCVASAFAFVQQPYQFYMLRVLLGAAEAGSFPGIWFTISLFFPPHRTSVPYAMLAVAVAISQVLAAPLAAGLLKLDGLLFGLRGWQILFVAEGLPSMLLGLALPWLLPDSPEDAAASGLLDAEELRLLHADMAVKPPLAASNPGLDAAASLGSTSASDQVLPSLKLLRHVMRVWQIWYLALCTVLKEIALMALMLWLPVMVHSLLSGADPTELAVKAHGSKGPHEGGGSTDTGTAAVLLTSLPFSAAAAATAWVGRHAQRSQEALLYIIVLDLAGGFAFVSFHWLVHVNRAAGFACLIATMACAYAASPHALTIITKLMAGSMAAGIALPAFNSVAMLGGFVGPAVMGFVAERFGGFNAATVICGASMMAAGGLVIVLRTLMLRDPHTRALVSGSSSSGSELAPGFELVYRSSSTGTTSNRLPSFRRQRGALKQGDSSSSSSSGGGSSDDGTAAEPRTALPAVLRSGDSLVKRTASSSRHALPGQPRAVSETDAAAAQLQDGALRRLLAAGGGSFAGGSKSSTGTDK